MPVHDITESAINSGLPDPEQERQPNGAPTLTTLGRLTEGDSVDLDAVLSGERPIQL
jgi:hypothetical protein